jgi:NodT family efflux transporter outer membrane factor (OMF) lipoprotein
VDASWEADVWGRIRRSVEGAEATAQASAADLDAARLSAQSALAQNYFQLRALDSQQQLLDETVAAYAKSLQLTRNRYAMGVAARVDVVQAEAQLKSTQAQAIDIGVQRARIEHAMAVLLGKPAAAFSLQRAPLNAVPPDVPVGVPSRLLERRPDVAAAERRVAAANAGIGVAEAAFFPDFTLSASGGFASSSLAQWLTLPNRLWSVGPLVAATLFDGGRRRALSDQAVAAYEGEVATYRQTVLGAFAEVEDNLAALRILEQEAQIQQEALEAARQSLALTLNQYKAGTVSYLDVVTVQAAALNSERAAVDILVRQMDASVLLIKALGGGWDGTGMAAYPKH